MFVMIILYRRLAFGAFSTVGLCRAVPLSHSSPYMCTHFLYMTSLWCASYYRVSFIVTLIAVCTPSSKYFSSAAAVSVNILKLDFLKESSNK